MRLPQQNFQRPVNPVQFSFTVLSLLALLAVSAVLSPAQVASNPTILHFGSILIGQSETLPASLTNSESITITITAMSSTSNEFTVQGLKMPLVLSAGQTAAFTVTFSPTVSGWEGGDFAFTVNGSSQAIYLRIGGVGVTSEVVKSSTSSLGFGSVAVGSSSTLPIVLTNAGTLGVAIAQAELSGTGFSITGPTLPIVVLPGQTAAFNVTFTPQTATSFTGSVFFPNGSLTIPLNGTGTGGSSGQLVLTPTALSFGNVDVGTTATQPVTLSATGSAVTITSSASSSSQFAWQGATFPLTIPSGQSVSLNIGFTPNSTGSTSGTLSLTSNASDSSVKEGLSGTGITPTYNVTVSWNPSVSEVAGYNVYRGTTPGTYSKMNSTLDSSTTYTDNTVAAGQTYYYAATSVNSAGQESSYSAPVEAVVP
jgi:ASPM-SPD-2-Hydin domain-containing protein/HYDIN/CFA65/VesB family protein